MYLWQVDEDLLTFTEKSLIILHVSQAPRGALLALLCKRPPLLCSQGVAYQLLQLSSIMLTTRQTSNRQKRCCWSRECIVILDAFGEQAVPNDSDD